MIQPIFLPIGDNEEYKISSPALFVEVVEVEIDHKTFQKNDYITETHEPVLLNFATVAAIVPFKIDATDLLELQFIDDSDNIYIKGTLKGIAQKIKEANV